MRRRLLLGLALATAALGPTACSDDAAGDVTGGDTGEITVLAAASLTETFTALAEQFETAHPGVTVRLAFDSSATLAGQAAEGAPADVLATADAATMQDAVDAGAVAGGEAGPTRFATNVMTLVVPADNPAGLTSFADLERPDVDYVVCVETAPCGAVAAALLAANEVDADPASLETDVKAVLGKVVSDEADAGLVYVTDATAAGEAVRRIEVPDAESEVLDYPVAVLEQAREPGWAKEFIDLVLAAEGQAVLADAGFGAP